MSCRSTSRKFWSKIPDSLATYAGKKSARTLLYETTIFARLGCGVALPEASTDVALGGASAPAHDASTSTTAIAIANVLVIGRLPWWRDDTQRPARRQAMRSRAGQRAEE